MTILYIFRILVLSFMGILAPGGDSHMKQTGMLVGNFEFNP